MDDDTNKCVLSKGGICTIVCTTCEEGRAAQLVLSRKERKRSTTKTHSASVMAGLYQCQEVGTAWGRKVSAGQHQSKVQYYDLNSNGRYISRTIYLGKYTENGGKKVRSPTHALV